MTAPPRTRVEWPGVIRAYRERMPLVKDGWDVVTLREGGTPLLPAPHLSSLTGCQVHLKIEGANPTGSFKDRGMTVAMTEAAAGGAKAVICASTGNTSASAAAYAARTDLLTTLRGTVRSGTWLNASTAHYPAAVLGSVAARRLGITTPDPQVRIRVAGTWCSVIGVLDPVALAPELDTGVLVGWPDAQQYLGFDGHPTTIYTRTRPDQVDAVDREVLGGQRVTGLHRRAHEPAPRTTMVA